MTHASAGSNAADAKTCVENQLLINWFKPTSVYTAESNVHAWESSYNLKTIICLENWKRIRVEAPYVFVMLYSFLFCLSLL